MAKILILILGWLYYGENFVKVDRSALLRNFDISVGRAAQKSVSCNVEFGYQIRICFKKRTARNGTGLSEDLLNNAKSYRNPFNAFVDDILRNIDIAKIHKYNSVYSQNEDMHALDSSLILM
jgi:hypothetical protein